MLRSISIALARSSLGTRAAEKLTGRTAAIMLHQTLTAELIGLTTIGGGKLVEQHCPITLALQGQATEHHKYLLLHTDGQELPVSLNTLLVRNSKNQLCGAILMIRDASHQVELEEQVQSLHEIAITDNLTNVSNRAELSRYLPEFVNSHLETSQPGSLIICDIDHFKRINDTYGHPAGDEALVVFARVLKQMARAGDLVARFGGEEFVILCSNCNITAAASRAESIRRAIEATPVQSLRNQCMTVSFGVTELQAGDNHETLLARADRALLMAKDSGRNRVIQIGQEEAAVEEPEKRSIWFKWFSAAEDKIPILERDYITAVPQDMAIERLSGFINDHKAEVIKVDDNRVAIRINNGQSVANRRLSDRPINLLMEIEMEEVELKAAGNRGTSSKQTTLHVTVRRTKNRDRRIVNVAEQANQLICSFRSYLVAQDLTEDLLHLIVTAPAEQ